jgi:hypothetical protein
VSMPSGLCHPHTVSVIRDSQVCGMLMESRCTACLWQPGVCGMLMAARCTAFLWQPSVWHVCSKQVYGMLMAARCRACT